ncbi:hypothetical protein [Desulfomicrobium apsheronum]|uniref:hypothetical protein n=1 Tax=Desulfomicrobium apsheronum TaxID=52560 RepID=UPI0015A6947B|nr:hypothetical protein [Desulfomicrobium apsheronum]
MQQDLAHIELENGLQESIHCVVLRLLVQLASVQAADWPMAEESGNAHSDAG